MKTKRRILNLARNTLEGHRGDAHQEFRAVVAANGYKMSRGGWVTYGDESVCRGWEAFAYMVSESKEIILRDVPRAETEETARDEESRAFHAPLDVVAGPDEILEAAVETAAQATDRGNPFPYPTRGLIPEVDAILDRRAAEVAATEAGYAPAPSSVEITYLYTTRLPTVRLSDASMVSALVVEDLEAVHEGPCRSGAALDCSGTGFLRMLPESMLAGQERVQMIQCLPCYEASAAAYLRKLHRYIQTEARA